MWKCIYVSTGESLCPLSVTIKSVPVSHSEPSGIFSACEWAFQLPHRQRASSSLWPPWLACHVLCGFLESIPWKSEMSSLVTESLCRGKSTCIMYYTDVLPLWITVQSNHSSIKFLFFVTEALYRKIHFLYHCVTIFTSPSYNIWKWPVSFLLTSLKSICFWCLKYYRCNTGDDHMSLLTQPGLPLRLLIWTQCAFAKCCLVIEVTFISSPILLKSNRMWCSNQHFVCLCVCVMVRGFHHQGIWVLRLVMVQHRRNRHGNWLIGSCC